MVSVECKPPVEGLLAGCAVAAVEASVSAPGRAAFLLSFERARVTCAVRLARPARAHALGEEDHVSQSRQGVNYLDTLREAGRSSVALAPRRHMPVIGTGGGRAPTTPGAIW